MASWRNFTVFIFLGLGLAMAPVLRAADGCVVSMLEVCSQLTENHYPADTVNWFFPDRHPQIVFFAHLLFPVLPDLETRGAAAAPGQENWHPPLVFPPLFWKDRPAAGSAASPLENHWAEAQWLGADGSIVASLGVTLTARLSSEYIHLDGKAYVPHTFAMAIGTRDIRPEAGQKIRPQAGLYHIRFYVDGKQEGIAFFTVMGEKGTATPAQAPENGRPLSSTARPTPEALKFPGF